MKDRKIDTSKMKNTKPKGWNKRKHYEHEGVMYSFGKPIENEMEIKAIIGDEAAGILPKYHEELIAYFKGRTEENFSMNQEQKQLIIDSFQSEYGKGFDSSCKYQCIYAYIQLFKMIDKKYKIKGK